MPKRQIKIVAVAAKKNSSIVVARLWLTHSLLSICLNDGYITVVFLPGSPLRSTKNANSDTFPAETEASYLQSIPAFSKHFRTSRIVTLQDFHFLESARLGFGSPRPKTISGQGTLCCSLTSTPQARDILVLHYKLCRASVIDASQPIIIWEVQGVPQ